MASIKNDIVVFDYIPIPVFTHTTGMTQFQVLTNYFFKCTE